MVFPGPVCILAVTRARILYSCAHKFESLDDYKSLEERVIYIRKIMTLFPREDSNLGRKSLPIQSLSVVGLFELPRKLPIPIARCDGTA